MAAYLLRRLAQLPVTLLGVTLLIFAVLQLLSPIERSALYIPSPPRNPEAVQGIIRRYGLDDPLAVQYGRWLIGRRDPRTGELTGGVLRGELGYSRVGGQPVAELIRQRFPATVELVLWSVLPIFALGIGLGVAAALRHDRWFDQAVRLFSLVGYALPGFVLGLLLLMVFYARLDWFPPGRLSQWAATAIASPGFHSYTRLVTLDAVLNLRGDIFLDALRHLVLPVATLAYLTLAILLRVTRASMLDVLRQDYVRTARAKGMAERHVIFRHALPNALIPVITLGGLLIFGLLNGVVIIEVIFNYPGIGSAAAAASAQLDVVTVLGLTLFYGVLLGLTNLVVDLLYVIVNPQIRLG